MYICLPDFTFAMQKQQKLYEKHLFMGGFPFSDVSRM